MSKVMRVFIALLISLVFSSQVSAETTGKLLKWCKPFKEKGYVLEGTHDALCLVTIRTLIKSKERNCRWFKLFQTIDNSPVLDKVQLGMVASGDADPFQAITAFVEWAENSKIKDKDLGVNENQHQWLSKNWPCKLD